MTDAPSTTGRFVWHDLMAKDPERARVFYGELFGWSVTEMDMGEMGKYQMLTRGGPETGLGGIVPFTEAPEEVPSHWVEYVSVEDVDATCRKAEELGGKACVPPTDIPNVGRFAVVEDAQGAILSPFRSLEPGGADDVKPGAGEFCWYELMTDDVDSAIAFYGGLYGWRFEKSPMPDMDYWLGHSGDVQVCGLMKKPDEVPHCHWLAYVAVEDLAKSQARAVELGGQVVHGPTQIPTVGSFTVALDPGGAVFALFQGASTP